MGAHHIGPLHAMVLWPESPSDLCYSCAPLMVLQCYIDGVALFVDGVGAFLKSLNLQSNVFSMWPIFLELFNHSMIRVLCLNLKFRKEIPMYT